MVNACSQVIHLQYIFSTSHLALLSLLAQCILYTSLADNKMMIRPVLRLTSASSRLYRQPVAQLRSLSSVVDDRFVRCV